MICRSDFIGELVPYYMRLTNLSGHMSPELAGELSAFSFLGSTCIVTRAVRHYPHTRLVVQDGVERGAKVGRESAPFLMAEYEDVLHGTREEARERLGIRGVRMVGPVPHPPTWH